MRLNHYLAQATNLSRRAADEAIKAQRVRVGAKLGKIGQEVEPSDVVTLDDQVVHKRLHQATILLHKPVGYVSSRKPQGQLPTVYQLVPPDLQHLQIAGRLDQDSSGLLILTSDGQLLYQLTHPKFDKVKVYELKLTKPLSEIDRHQLEEGVMLADGSSRMKVIEAQSNRVIVGLSEGRNRQIRRTFGALDYGITSLHRLSIGSYQLADLASGSWKLAHVRGVRHA